MSIIHDPNRFPTTWKRWMCLGAHRCFRPLVRRRDHGNFQDAYAFTRDAVRKTYLMAQCRLPFCIVLLLGVFSRLVKYVSLLTRSVSANISSFVLCVDRSLYEVLWHCCFSSAGFLLYHSAFSGTNDFFF